VLIVVVAGQSAFAICHGLRLNVGRQPNRDH
jgi:hypothetical protein